MDLRRPVHEPANRPRLAVLLLWLLLASPAPVRAAEPAAPIDPALDFLHVEPEEKQADEFALLVEQLPRVRSSGRVVRSVALLGVIEDPSLTGQALHWLLPRWIDRVAVESRALEALSERFELNYEWTPEAETHAAAVRAGTAGAASIAKLNRELGVDASVVLRASLIVGWPGGIALRAGIHGGRSEPSVFEDEAEIRLAEGLEAYGAWNYVVLSVLGLVALAALRPALSGSGRLVVQLPAQASAADGPPGQQGESDWKRGHKAATNIQLRPRGGAATKAKKDDKRFVRAMVGATTEFANLPVGSYSVEARRVFRDAETSEITCIQSEDKLAVIRRGEVVRLAFELAREVVMVEVQVRDGEEAVVDERAAVALRGQTSSVRYVRGGTTTLELSKGEHTVLVGVDDRVFERRVEIEHVSRRTCVIVDVQSDEGIVFAGCSDAVTPYVQGDLDAAIRVLEEAGRGDTAHLVRAEFHRGRGELAQAANSLEAAGATAAAAEAAAEAEQFAQAGRLFEALGDFDRAGDYHRRAGNFEAAIAAFERSGDLQSAVACAFQTGDRGQPVDLLERHGKHFEASRIALELDEHERAIKLLQRVPMRDEHYGEACVMLTHLFHQRDEPALAMQKLDEAVNEFGSDDHLELREQVALQLERGGQLQAALEAFETIRKRDIHYPGVAEKIESLRTELQQATNPPVASGGGPAVAALESRYEILEELGRGAMGIVFKARDVRLERIVALKRLPDSLKEHPMIVDLFLREARAVAQLSHPNVVTLFDADEVGGVYYLTMECLEGYPFDKILEKRGRLSVRDAVGVGLQIASGLQYAHERGIVHRDIKPANLFYTQSRQVKIMDFGLAKMVAEVRKSKTVVGGTPYYMPPEQAAGESVDHRADLYAFGVTLFQFVCGQLPFREGDVLYHHRHTPPPDPLGIVPELPPELAALILRLLAKEPAGRFDETATVVNHLTKLAAELQKPTA